MTQLTLPPWSFSMLEAFEQCPRKMFHRYVLKEKSPETPEQRKGNEFDKAMETRLKSGKPLPAEWQHVEPFAASFIRDKTECALYTQMKIGLTRKFEQCDFFSKIVWGRGVLDVALIRRGIIGQRSPKVAIIADWKTGKNSEGKAYSNYGLQLKIFALMVLKFFPGVDHVTAFNIYVKDGQIGKPLQFNRTDEAALWLDLLPRIVAMEKAFEAFIHDPGNLYGPKAFCERPGPLCGWCDVKTCRFNKT